MEQVKPTAHTKKDSSRIHSKSVSRPCDVYERCANKSCFWKARDQFGMPVWWYKGVEEDAEKISKKFGIKGSIFFPKMTLGSVTNGRVVVCEDFKKIEKDVDNETSIKRS